MDAEDSRDPFAVETARLVQVLAGLVKSQRVSVRSLEKKMGVGDSVFSKVLKGKITLQMRHVLMICTALGIDWKDFFARAYNLDGTPVEPAPLPDDAELERRMIPILARLGVIPPDAAGGASAED